MLGSADPRFGGLSGLWLAPDGSRLLVISDHGTLWRADLEHRADGRLTGLAAWQAIEPGRAPGDPPGRDAEALADDGHGGLVIAYEGVHRLRRVALDDLSGPARPLPTPIALARPSNTGLEALTSLPDGALLALVEGGVRTADGDLGAWRIAGDQVQALGYVARGGFVPTGADRLDDTIYVVERSFSLLRGFESRIVTLPVAAVRPGARLAGQVLAELRPPLVGENFEGIAVRRGPEGRVLLYLVSDDNFIALERTLLLQVLAPRPGAPRRAGRRGLDRFGRGALGRRPGCDQPVFEPAQLARKLAVAAREQEAVEPAPMLDRAQRMGGDAQPDALAQGLAVQPLPAQIGQKAPPGLVVGMADVVARHHALAGQLAASRHRQKSPPRSQDRARRPPGASGYLEAARTKVKPRPEATPPPREVTRGPPDGHARPRGGPNARSRQRQLAGCAAARGQPAADLGRAQGVRDPVALDRIAAQAAQRRDLGLGLHALGDHPQPQAVTELDQRAHDRRVRRLGEAGDERAVDLQRRRAGSA